MGLRHRVDDGVAPAPWEVDVEQDHVGRPLTDHLHRGIDLIGLTDHLHGVPQLRPYPGSHQLMVVDQEDRWTALLVGMGASGFRRAHGWRAMTSSTSVPFPGALRMTAVPP